MVPGFVGIRFLLWNAGKAMAFKNPAGQINKSNAHAASEEQDPSMFCINHVVLEKCLHSHTFCLEFVLWFCIFFP